MITEIQTTDIAMGLKKGVRPKSRKPKTAANKYVKGRWGHSEKCGMMGGLVWEPVREVPWYQKLIFWLFILVPKHEILIGPMQAQENNSSNQQKKVHRTPLELAKFWVFIYVKAERAKRARLW